MLAAMPPWGRHVTGGRCPGAHATPGGGGSGTAGKLQDKGPSLVLCFGTAEADHVTCPSAVFDCHLNHYTSDGNNSSMTCCPA